MTGNSLQAEREYLANLLEAVQRCAHFMHASSSKVAWPLRADGLKQRQKDLLEKSRRMPAILDTAGSP